MRGPRSNTRDDYDKAKDSIHKLKSENRRLRKENSQLRKELNRVSEAEFDRRVDQEIEEELEHGTLEEVAVKPKVSCPKCKSEDYHQIHAGLYVIKACKTCGYRKRTEIKG